MQKQATDDPGASHLGEWAMFFKVLHDEAMAQLSKDTIVQKAAKAAKGPNGPAGTTRPTMGPLLKSPKRVSNGRSMNVAETGLPAAIRSARDVARLLKERQKQAIESIRAGQVGGGPVEAPQTSAARKALALADIGTVFVTLMPYAVSASLSGHARETFDTLETFSPSSTAGPLLAVLQRRVADGSFDTTVTSLTSYLPPALGSWALGQYTKAKAMLSEAPAAPRTTVQLVDASLKVVQRSIAAQQM
jgi:hypothetical protein